MRKDNFEEWIFTAVYASPNPRIRDIIWEELGSHAESNQNPWLIAGDFNDIVAAGECKSSAPDVSSSQRRKFADNINKCKLVDMGYTGAKYTWTNGRQGLANVQKRLDRALCNEEWRSLFPEGMIQILPRTYSDHAPLLLHVFGKNHRNHIMRPFRFEAAWILDPSFETVVNNNWTGSNLSEHIENFTKAAKDWNKNVFGNIFRKKRWIQGRLNGVKKAQETNFAHNLQFLERDLIKEFNDILLQEEVLWFQKSRSKWITLGEKKHEILSLVHCYQKKEVQDCHA